MLDGALKRQHRCLISMTNTKFEDDDERARLATLSTIALCDKKYGHEGFRFVMWNAAPKWDLTNLRTHDIVVEWAKRPQWSGWWEHKADDESLVTGRIFIEYRCSWMFSGIYTSKSPTYAIRYHHKDDPLERHLLVPLSRLHAAHKNGDYFLKNVHGGNKDNAEGMLIMVEMIESWPETFIL